MSGAEMPMPPSCAAALLVLEEAIDTLPARANEPATRSILVSFLSAPFIYGVALPLVLLDLAVTAYQWACFPVYGIARVERRPYFVFDRARLPFLSRLQKLNCVYCSYANGLIAYVREVAARTEQYWCPLRNARQPKDAHARYGRFVAPHDVDELRRKLADLRAALAAERAPVRE